MSGVAWSPRYSLRRHLAIRTLRSVSSGSLIEFGSGTGALLPELADLGFYGVGIEVSPEMARLAREAVAASTDRFQILTDLAEVGDRRFEYGCAFEVLEHLEDDLEHLREWADYLVPGGLLLASVPAHMRFWTDVDEAVGHYRRYERDQVAELFGAAGMEILALWNYGYPLTSATRWARQVHARLIPSSPHQEERTMMSAAASRADVPRMLDWISRGIGVAGHVAQLPFLTRDLGDGYFIIAKVNAGLA